MAEQECLHCALMRALDEWGKDIGTVPVEDIVADLGEVAGHVMACTDIPCDDLDSLLEIAPIIQALVVSTLKSFRRYREAEENIEQEIGESGAGHTLQ